MAGVDPRRATRFLSLLAPRPDYFSALTSPDDNRVFFDCIHFFVIDRAVLGMSFSTLNARLTPAELLKPGLKFVYLLVN